MAELFFARPQGDERDVVFVLKRILPQYAKDAEFVRMFLREVSIASTICHPALVPVVDHGHDGDCHFMVMEYVHGPDLATLLERSVEAEQPIPFDVAIAITAQAAAGLHHLHEHPDRDGGNPHLVHRDVSPSNVLVSYEGAVRVTDFGIATASAYTRATRAGTLKGKAGYMSPEQCRGDAIDRRSDVFALGIVLYELTVGERLFFADNDYAVMNKIVEGRFERPSSRRSGYPPGLESIVMRALAPDPAQRYATAADLQRALERFASASGMKLWAGRVRQWISTLVEARPYPAFAPSSTVVCAVPLVASPARAPAQRRWAASIAVGVGTAAVLLAVGLGRSSQDDAQSHSDPDPTPAADEVRAPAEHQAAPPPPIVAREPGPPPPTPDPLSGLPPPPPRDAPTAMPSLADPAPEGPTQPGATPSTPGADPAATTAAQAPAEPAAPTRRSKRRRPKPTVPPTYDLDDARPPR